MNMDVIECPATAVPPCLGAITFTERRQPSLIDPVVRLALREDIVSVRQALPFKIDGWVLLPDQLHAICSLPAGDADFQSLAIDQAPRHARMRSRLSSTRAPDKRRTANQCGTLWQHRFWEHLIRAERDYLQHRDYLHPNPVKHGLVGVPVDWPWSSFHRWVRHGLYPADRVGSGAVASSAHDVE